MSNVLVVCNDQNIVIQDRRKLHQETKIIQTNSEHECRLPLIDENCVISMRER